MHSIGPPCSYQNCWIFCCHVEFGPDFQVLARDGRFVWSESGAGQAQTFGLPINALYVYKVHVPEKGPSGFLG